MEKNKIIIIGGGVAGLSTGIYGQLNGFETQIFEMHDKPGGQCTTWERKGYMFDFCLHWLIGTKSSVFNEIWKETNVINENVQIVDSEIHTVVMDDHWGEFIIYSNIDKWQDYLLQMAPADEKGIRRMCRHMRMSAKLEPFYKAPEIRKFTDYFMALLKMRDLLFILNRYSKISAVDYFDALKLKDTRLRYFLDKMFGDSKFSALIVIMMLGWFHAKNAGYLVGGSLALSKRMADKYHQLGGTILFRKRVTKILVENGKAIGIRLTDGSEYKADYIISAADGHSTLFEMLEGKYLSPKLKEAYENWDIYNPFVQVSFGVNEKLTSKAATVSYLKDKFTIGPIEFNHGYSIMNQSAIDPTLAESGKTSIVLRFDTEWKYWENMQQEEYDTMKKLIQEEGIHILEKHYPGIKEKIEVVDVSTPKTMVKYTGVWKGAYEGFLPTGNMVKKTLNNTLPNLKAFYMAGQWMFPGGGLPPAAQSGKWVIQTICSSGRLKFREK